MLRRGRRNVHDRATLAAMALAHALDRGLTAEEGAQRVPRRAVDRGARSARPKGRRLQLNLGKADRLFALATKDQRFEDISREEAKQLNLGMPDARKPHRP